MAFNAQTASSSRSFRQMRYGDPISAEANQPRSSSEPQFDLFEWYPHFQSCHRYFLDHAQHSAPVQALAAFVNIILPCQREHNPVLSSGASSPHAPGSIGIPPPRRQAGSPLQGINHVNPQSVSLTPYIRRLVVTGFDTAATLHGMFGDDWQEGIGRLHEVERRNYLFASKSSNWLEVKANYDMSPTETIPFMQPLQQVTEKEILAAEARWSDWLAMQDWMVGPRALDALSSDAMESSPSTGSPQIKREV